MKAFQNDDERKYVMPDLIRHPVLSKNAGFGLSRLCRNYHFCHSVQAKRDTESSIFSKFWMPAFAGMTVLIALSTIATQSLRRN